MDETLLSVGLDVGTTSTQLIVSRLTISNRASAFTVPEMEIADRKILYRSPIHFTPLLEGNLVDGDKIRVIVEQEYENAGISRQDVDTGAVIITGETSRKENAKAVLDALSEYAGDFVVATAGPDLESVLAARGAGATAYSQQTGKRVFHMDIGGGTSNLALIADGKILCTDCLNVGGRLIKCTETGRITYISPVLDGLCKFSVGDAVTENDLMPVAQMLTEALEMAAGLRPATELLARLRTAELGTSQGCRVENAVISFSGGVADCIETQHPPFAFGDMGPILGRAIRQSRLCQQEYRLGGETIRATVIGAGCHSAQLSGSTVYLQNVPLPLKNRPVVAVSEQELSVEGIRQKLAGQDTLSVLALPGFAEASYSRIKELAAVIAEAVPDPILVCVEQDMAKALGQAIALCRGPDAGILCIDRVRLKNGDYLDVGSPIGPALPVVVKTLILEK
ncbi:MAG: ethanolamine ammonia-lyase [Ruminococcaceae bacterium]|nr:ethanolamine ammonia-lyase [Oscillospiraceae bacterium]